MNVNQISMPEHRAKEAFENYRKAVKQRHDKEDEMIMRGYKALSKGQRIIDIVEAFEIGGINNQGLPRLAIAGATAKQVMMISRIDSREISFFWGAALKTNGYSWERYRVNPYATRSIFTTRIESEILEKVQGQHIAIVPNIPPQFRPQRGIQHLRILWEVDRWQKSPRPPYDPLLIKHIGGNLYVVLAEWDLTELERAVLAGTRSVN